jgi:hypothetical protein
MEIFYGKPTGYSFEEILDQYSPKDLKSAETSTVPFLNHWKTTRQATRRLQEGLGLCSEPTTLAFEYPTPSAGNNKSSMTDLMVWGDSWKIAIEAKYTEVTTSYETVAQWNAEYTPNRSRVAAHWLEMIDPYSQAELDEKLVSDVSYQFLHRTASACYCRPQQAYVLYQVFYAPKTEVRMHEFIDILRRNVAVLQPNQNLRFALNTIEIVRRNQGVNKENVLQVMKEKDIYSYGESDWQWLDR